MKSITLTIVAIFFFLLPGQNLRAQNAPEKYGKTLNLGLGLVYAGYIGHPVLAVHADFEFDVVKNFTLAPSISCYTYSNNYYWGNKNYPYRYYGYHETVIPIGVKGTYYFDQLFKANSKWDFYAAGSLGFAIIQSTWEDGYYGEKYMYRNSYHGTSPFYVDVHAGAEYHMTQKLGLFLDLSTGISTFGLGIHF